MIEIKIKVEVPDLSRAIQSLASAIAQKTIPVEPIPKDAKSIEVPGITPAPALPEGGPVVRAKSTVQPSAAEKASAEPEQTPVAELTSQPEPVQASYTIAQIANAGAALCQQKKMPQLVALLRAHGVEACTQLEGRPAEEINAIAEELKALGATF